MQSLYKRLCNHYAEVTDDKEINKLIKKNENISFVDLINKAVSKKMNIGVYPITSNAWIDLGQSIDFIRKK